MQPGKSQFLSLTLISAIKDETLGLLRSYHTNPLFFFTISDIGYLGMVFAYVVDIKNKRHHEETLTLPFGGGVQLPRNNREGKTIYKSKNVTLIFNVGPQKRQISVHWKNFDGGQDLNAELEMDLHPDHESMNIVIPIEKRRFYYNRKINCLPVSGWVEYLGKKQIITPDTCLGNLDWGRGVWAYRSFWVWASASGFTSSGQKIGLNLGYGFGDTSAATENAFILDDHLHKLDQVKFTYDNKDFMKPWSMQSDDDRLQLTFTPFYERIAKTDVKILYSEVHQIFGVYSGRLVTDDGRTIPINNLTGFAEEHHARW